MAGCKHILSASNRSYSCLPLTVLSDDEKLFKDTVRKFSEKEVKPRVRSMETAGQLDPELIRKYFEHGFMGIEVETKYGGAESGFMNMVILLEEISKVDAAASPIIQVQNVLVSTVLRKAASEEHKLRYLPQLCSEKLGSFALTEPDSGSDAFSLATHARQDGDDYVINGSKMFITGADVADIFLIMANAKPELGYRGITCFIVERNTKGLIVHKREDKLGIQASGTCALTLDNVRVHKSQILGEHGKGYLYAIKFLTEGRIGVAAQMIGLAQGCFNVTIPYLLERKQFGKSLFMFQGMQHQIAQVATQIEAARLMTYNAARLVEQKRDFTKEAAMAKSYAAEVAQLTTVKCIDWMGGLGYMKSLPQEKYYRDVKIGSIYEGTYNIQLNTIANKIHSEFGL